MSRTRDRAERFTIRLEAFSDLVFGFSLSLLATRLEIPARVEDIFNGTRWLAIIVTFAFVCRFWLEHYRVFRHDFVARGFDAVVNFIFLFAIAILPYSLQTFLRFKSALPSFSLYGGDIALILFTLSILRLRSLRQRRSDPEIADRIREWRRSVIQVAVAVLMALLILALPFHGGTFDQAMQAFGVYVTAAFLLIILLGRFFITQLPAFLANPA